jgi:hypothetical protein
VKFDSRINFWDLVWESGATPIKCTYPVHLSIFSRFNSRINSWEDLIRESKATPNRCTYLHFSEKKTWWDSVRDILALDQSQTTLNKLFQVGWSTRQLRWSRKIWLIWSKLACQALGGCWRGWIPWVPRLLDSAERNKGHTKSWSTRPEGTGQEAHDRGGLEDNYRIWSCK